MINPKNMNHETAYIAGKIIGYLFFFYIIPSLIAGFLFLIIMFVFGIYLLCS